MSRIIYRQLIGHEDFALGPAIITQERGNKTVSIRQIELEFIIRTVDEIKELDYNVYAHVSLFNTIGPVVQYYFDSTSTAVSNDVTVIKPNLLLSSQAGRYLRVAIVLDTIIASISDEYTSIVVSGGIPAVTFRAPYALDLLSGYVRISLTTAPQGSVFIVDVHMNGTTLFSTLLQIDISEDTSVTANVQAILSTTIVPDDAKFEAYVIQVGSSVAGTGLKVAVTGSKVS